jgi:benzylsuccinate CoA-transferase BbsE subunit
MLSLYNVLDLTDEKGTYCGKILAELGANVVKVEPPGGSKERLIGPFANDIADLEKSLFWFAFNRGKKSITLNLESQKGKEFFKRLLEHADIVTESFKPGYLESIGLGYPILREVNPGIIVISISPFGQVGPYKDYKGSDLVTVAMSGYMYSCGDPDRPPVRVSSLLAYNYAAAEAAVGCLIALYSREMTGEGQHVDVSAQEAMSEYTLMAPLFWDTLKKKTIRSGQFRAGGSIKTRDIWPCKDGWVSFSIYGGQLGGRMNEQLVAWMESDGISSDFLRGIDWNELDLAKISIEYIEEIEKFIQDFFAKHTRNELYEGAIERGINLCPVWTSCELLNSVQLKARDFWVEVNHPELGIEIIYPGSFFKSSDVQCQIGNRAPLIGEHNHEIYKGKLGLSDIELQGLMDKGVI